MRSSALAALATLAAAAALLLSGGREAPNPAPALPRMTHAPTHYESSFAGLFPARDVWGHDLRTR